MILLRFSHFRFNLILWEREKDDDDNDEDDDGDGDADGDDESLFINALWDIIPSSAKTIHR